MKPIIEKKISSQAILMALIILILSACLKPSDSEIKPSNSAPFKNSDIVKALAEQSSLSLFTKAFNRLKLAGRLEKTKNYTLFAPTDSAMNAAGLTESTINSITLDSLTRLITYHIALGAFDDFALNNSAISIRTFTLRQDTSFNRPTGYSVLIPPLYIKKNGVLYFNGFPAGGSKPPVETSNGYIYSITRVLGSTLNQTLYDIIKTDPELSLYNQALILNDSLTTQAQAFAGISNPQSLDVYRFSNDLSLSQGLQLQTLLAPTNTAFNKAGFYTIDDIRKYALRTPAMYDMYNDDFTVVTSIYSPIDSVLKLHMIYNNAFVGNKVYPVLVLYNDLAGPNVNNGIFNISYAPTSSAPLKQPFNLKFSDRSGLAYVQWNANPASVTLLERDADPRKPIKNFVCTNGALYKIDQLFYPHN